MTTGLTAAEAALFKGNDIRGPAPRPLTPELAFRVGRAFAGMLDGDRLGLARDMRTTSPALAAAFAAGAAAGGAQVTWYGLLASDAMWFAVRQDRLDGGAMITASHNPLTDNGIKLVERGASPIFAENRLPEVRRRTGATPRPAAAEMSGAPTLPVREIREEYLDFLLGQIEGRRLPPLRVVLDAGNGMGGLVAAPLFARVPGDFVQMDFEPDAVSPSRGGNPLDPASRVGLAERVRTEKADFGVLWDADADRCAFVDGDGGFVPGDFTTAILAPAEIAAEPGAAVVYDRRSSRAVPDAIRRAGGRPVLGRVGHAYMKRKMRDADARFGGELSAHYYFRAAGYADNALLPILRLVERLGSAGRSLRELADDLRQRYHTLDEKSVAVPDTDAALARVREAFPGGEAHFDDGLSVDFADWRFTLRPSNTEPVLRLTVEALRVGLVERREAEILSVLGETEGDPAPGGAAPAPAGGTVPGAPVDD